jgi:hypothetical protein
VTVRRTLPHPTAAMVASDLSAKNKNSFELFLFVVGLGWLGQDVTVTIQPIT